MNLPTPSTVQSKMKEYNGSRSRVNKIAEYGNKTKVCISKYLIHSLKPYHYIYLLEFLV